MVFLVSVSSCIVTLVYVPSFILNVTMGSKLVTVFAIQFDSIVVDYLHTRKFPVIGQIAKWGLRTATVATLVGIYQFNTNDIGMLS